MSGGRRNLLLLGMLMVAGLSLWLGRGNPLGGPPAPAPIGDEVRALRLVVLNGTDRPGLAHDVAVALGLVGCPVERIANAPHAGFARTLLVDRRLDGTVERLARRLGGIPVVKEADPDADEDAVLILGADHRVLRGALLLPEAP